MQVEQDIKYFIQKERNNDVGTVWENYYTNGGMGYSPESCKSMITDLRGMYTSLNFRVVKVTLTVEEIE